MRTSHTASANTGWCDLTFTPWRGCEKLSAGCDFCEAARWAGLIGDHVWGKDAPRRLSSERYWREPEQWHQKALRSDVRERVFCGSSADVFEDRRDLDAPRERLWALLEQTPALDWQLLTRRPENISRMVPSAWMQTWPGHVWIGASTEDRASAVRRAAELLKIPAEIRFLSVEPLLGPIPDLPLDGIHWVIVGGESGSHRAMDLAWARDIRDQCADAHVALWVKQLGGRWDKRDKLDQFPEDLRIQEFPRGTALEVEAA